MLCVPTLYNIALYPGAWAFLIYFKDTAMCIYTVYTSVYERIQQDVPNYLIVSSHCHLFVSIATQIAYTSKAQLYNTTSIKFVKRRAHI